MSKKEERKMVFEMLSEGKINVGDAETLLQALESSRRVKRPMGFAGVSGFPGLNLEDLQFEIEGRIEEGLGHLDNLGDILGDFDFEFDLDMDFDRDCDC